MFRAGVELEIGFYPNKAQRKLVFNLLKSLKAIHKKHKPSDSRMRQLMTEYVLVGHFNKTEVVQDGEAEEIIFKPYAVEFFVKDEGFIKKLPKLTEYGYHDKIVNTPLGIHHTFLKQELNGIKSFDKMLELIYEHRYMIYRFSKRPGITDKRADIRHLLGDVQ